MKPAERGALIGVVFLLAAACAFMVWKAVGHEDARPAPAASRGGLPDLGKPLRTFRTPGGVEVQVQVEGRGEPLHKGETMDLYQIEYLAKTGEMLDRREQRLVPAEAGLIPGLVEGLEGIKRGEKRRLGIPSALAYKHARAGNIPPDSDLVFDVRWMALEKKDLVVGTGDMARMGSTVTVNYRGTFEDGREFDSSYSRHVPATFTLRAGGLIQGWLLGVPGMRVGGKRHLWVPWNLAYGAKGNNRGRVPIPPYTNLVFDIELIGVK
jgi:peptidylprolyl isomerase